MTQHNTTRKAAIVRPTRRVRRERHVRERPPVPPARKQQEAQQAAEREYGRLAQEADHLFDTSADWW
jgi:hypothetical protein